jgi:hypothetical protein
MYSPAVAGRTIAHDEKQLARPQPIRSELLGDK